MVNFSRDKLYKSKIQTELLKLNFPVLIAILLKDYDSETTKKVLKKIGADMSHTWLNYFTPPKGNDIRKIFIKNTRKTFGKLKIETIEDPENGNFSLIFHDCPLCKRDIEILSEVPYCISIAGFYEDFFNELAKTRDFWFKKISGTTKMSISSGDEYCEHYFEVIE
jgi:hypothetical protein